MENVSMVRLYLLRTVYLLNFALIGSDVLRQFIQQPKVWDPLPGVAFSFWGALALLSGLGLRYPLAMLPVIFMQVVYKTVWLLTVYLPLRAAGLSTEMTPEMAIGLVIDLLVIPWPHVFARYISAPGDRWK